MALARRYGYGAPAHCLAHHKFWVTVKPTDQTHRLKYSIFELFSKTHRTEPQTQKYYITICQLNLLKPTDMKLIRDKYLPFVYTFS